MAHAMGVRATSFAASAVLLGLAVLGALSVSVTLTQIPLISPPPVELANPPADPPKPQPPVIRQTPPQNPVADETPTEQPVEVSQPTPIDFVAPVAPPRPIQITNPHWLQRPRDLGVYYPRRAEARGVTGEVVLDCLVTTSGRLNCDVVSETPTSWGFAEAALRISRDHRMVPATQDGTPVQGRYRMRVPFEVQ